MNDTMCTLYSAMSVSQCIYNNKSRAQYITIIPIIIIYHFMFFLIRSPMNPLFVGWRNSMRISSSSSCWINYVVPFVCSSVSPPQRGVFWYSKQALPYYVRSKSVTHCFGTHLVQCRASFTFQIAGCCSMDTVQVTTQWTEPGDFSCSGFLLLILECFQLYHFIACIFSC